MRLRNAAGAVIRLRRANLGGAEIGRELAMASGAFVDVVNIQRFIVLEPASSEETCAQDPILIRVLLEVLTKTPTSGENADGGPGTVIDISDGNGVRFLDDPDNGGPGTVIDISDGDVTGGQTLTYRNQTRHDMVFNIVEEPGSDDLFIPGEPRSAYSTEVEIRQQDNGQLALYIYQDLQTGDGPGDDNCPGDDLAAENKPPPEPAGANTPSGTEGRSKRTPQLEDLPSRVDHQPPPMTRDIAYAGKDILPDGKLLGEVLDKIIKNSEPDADAPSSLPTAKAALSRRIADLDCRLKITRHARLLFKNFYANRPLKESLYAVEPVRRLTLLQHALKRRRQQLESRLRHAGSNKEPEPIVLQDPRTEMLDFHLKIHEIFTSVRDRHVSYSPSELFDPSPDPGGNWSAFLGFQVEAYHEPAKDDTLRRKYLVAHVVQRLKRTRYRQQSHGVVFEKGVEVLSWNGMPISRAVELNAARQAGSNSAARHAHGLSLLTLRPLEASLPPDEEHVVVTYRRPDEPDGAVGTILFHWQLIRFDPHLGGRQLISNQPVDELLDGFDYEGEAARMMRGVFFGIQPNTASATEAKAVSVVRKDPRGTENTHCKFRNYMRAWELEPEPDGKRYGYIRLYTFSHTGVTEEAFANEFRMLIEKLPPDGLIIDVRDNPGGKIRTGERLLQYLTPQQIEPARFEFLATPPVLELVCRHPFWKHWKESIDEAQETGATHSRGFPITRDLDRETAALELEQETEFRRYPAVCNRVGQRYHGPVVLITNALCYSTTDIFAAGFQDHNIGRILGVDGTTGAGGANVIDHRQLVALAKQLRAEHPIPPDDGNVHSNELDELLNEDLPPGISMRVAIRRSLRVGERSGMLLEDLGVKPDDHHHLTRNDLLHHNEDLLDTAKKLLEGMPRYKLNVKAKDFASEENGDQAELTIKVENVSRVDLYHNNTPLYSRSASKTHVRQLKEKRSVSWEIKGWKVDLQGTIRLEGFAPKDYLGGNGSKDVLVAARCEDLHKLVKKPADP